MMTDAEIVQTYGDTLVRVAVETLRFGLQNGHPPVIDANAYAEPLRAPRASFVTLEYRGALRGCIGSVVARQALVKDVAANAYGAGFHDPRFPALTAGVLGALSIGISILGPFEALACDSEAQLFALVHPGEHGFVVTAEGRRGLFLPQVWESLPSPALFFAALREKAGLPRDYWSSQLRIERFLVTAVPKRAVSACEEA